MRIAPCDDRMDEEVVNVSSDGGRQGQQGSSVAQDLTYSGCCRNYWAAGSSPAL
jgi:hypothetical protein